MNPKLRDTKRFHGYSGYDPIQSMLDRIFKEKKQNFGRKRKSTGCIFLSGSGLRDAVGNYKMRSCLHDAVINAAVRIGKNINKLELYRQCPPRRVKDSNILEIEKCACVSSVMKITPMSGIEEVK